MKLEKISLHKLGPFEDLEIEVQPCNDPKRADVHVFVGENGTGKSTILRAIAGCLALDRGRLQSSATADDAFAAIHTQRDALAIFPLSHRRSATATEQRFGAWKQVDPGPFVARSQADDELAALRRAQQAADRANEPQQTVRAAAFAFLEPMGTATRSQQGIMEIQADPLASNAAGGFMQWVLNQDAQEKYARAAGDIEAADRFAATRATMERVLSELFERTITFHVETNPFVAVLHVNGEPLDSGVLPSGFMALFSWLTDLFVRLNRLRWEQPGPALTQPFILLLDEVDLHLHPAWQRKILAVVQDLFPNAQVFVSTHSPFVVSSVSDAWIYPLRLNGKNAELGTPVKSQVGSSYSTVLREVLGIESEFSLEAEQLLKQFREARTRRLAGDENAQVDLERLALKLSEWTETRSIVGHELRQIERLLKTAVA